MESGIGKAVCSNAGDWCAAPPLARTVVVRDACHSISTHGETTTLSTSEKCSTRAPGVNVSDGRGVQRTFTQAACAFVVPRRSSSGARCRRREPPPHADRVEPLCLPADLENASPAVVPRVSQRQLRGDLAT